MLLIAILLASLIVGTAFYISPVAGWKNGSYSTDPSNPGYGTHDWIAHHALDWLPMKEKQFILANLAYYLYGTELPDNAGAPDGIGDTVKHHVYYFANGSLQDDAAAKRAQEEYARAVSLYMNGDLVNAAKTLGVMSHYIADLGVFGHVMGASTDWGGEVHHDDYESYVLTRTNSYEDDFNTFLVFDGSLSNISAYDAALALAYDTTFHVNGELTCVWMDQNYNWGNPTFRSRCGELLNLAVNLIADVLYTFFQEMQGAAHFINVPFYYQDTDYYCGPACLAMVFDYYGENISQYEIADVARTIGPPVYSTFTDELRRATHFSNISTSTGNEMPGSIQGYSLRKLGYAAFEAHDMSLEQLKSYIDQNIPLILLMWYSHHHVSTHYRVVTGYNGTHIFLHDPWNKPLWTGTYGGPNLAFNYSAFMDLWSYYSYWALYASPWIIDVSAPSYVEPETPFQVNATITYPQPLPNALNNYPAASCNATITLPANISLALGETTKKTLGTGFLEAGANSTVSWTLVANSVAAYNISIEVEGLVSGSVWSHGEYPSYDYSDRIGATANFMILSGIDENVPLIGMPSRIPSDIVQPYEDVLILVNVTDAESGVKNVTLYYSMNNSETWTTMPMSYNSTLNLYTAVIFGQPAYTHVRFKIVAYDFVGNNATRDGEVAYCMYYVIPEYPLNIAFLLLIIFAMSIVLYMKKPKRQARKPSICY